MTVIRNKRTGAEIDMAHVMGLLENGEDRMGVCTSCGEYADGVEPDARGYKCEACGEKRVSGLEEIVIRFA